MKYTSNFFKNSMPDWKKRKDSVVARFIHRRISFFFSAWFANHRVTSNQVSFLSLIIAFLTDIFFVIPGFWTLFIGALFLNLWSIVDSADGNMARSIGGQPFGDFIDATSSYALIGFMFAGLGINTFYQGGILIHSGNPWIIYVGALASAFDTMSRLFFQKMKNNQFQINQNKQLPLTAKTLTSDRLRKLQEKVDSEIGIGGWCMILIFPCIIFHAVDIYILFYFVYYGAFFAASTIYLIRHTQCLHNPE